MDLLYRAYSNPLDLMTVYINQGRFGEFVREFTKLEVERIRAEQEKEEDNRLWLVYVLSDAKKSFNDWKKSILSSDSNSVSSMGGDEQLDNEGMESIMQNLFPNRTKQQGGE